MIDHGTTRPHSPQADKQNADPPDTAWVFGLARSGTSITAYAIADACNAAVADEILGPWDRTGEPYSYPPEQAELVKHFKASHARLTPHIIEQTNALHRRIAADAGKQRIVSKHPHLRFTPDEFAEHFPAHRGVWILRNPLRRLASIHARGWTSIIRPNHDLDYIREYAERWLDLPDDRRLIYEDLRRDPQAFFQRAIAALGWLGDDSAPDRAVTYQRSQYHGKSGEREEGRSTKRSLSDTARVVPEDAVDLYTRDPFMRDLFTRCGWSLKPSDYLPTLRQRAARKLRAIRNADST
ncbi:MAG: hypothetical protein AAFR96_11050 [Planctomycetota bacterium]